MTRLHKIKYTLSFFIGLLSIIGIMGLIPYHHWQNFRDTERNVARDYQVIATLQDILNLMQDMETGQRGYIITGDTYFLEPYLFAYGLTLTDLVDVDSLFDFNGQMGPDRLPASLGEQMNRLFAYAETEADQQAYDYLRDQVVEKIRYMNFTIRMVNDGNAQAAIDTIRMGHGQVLMENIRSFVHEAIGQRQQSLGVLIAASDRSEVDYTAYVMGVYLALGVLLALAFLGLLVSHGREVRARKALTKNDERMRMFVRNLPAAVGMMDRDLRFVIASKRWPEEFGVKASPEGRTLEEIFPHYQTRTDWQDAVRRCMAGDVVRVPEDRIERKGRDDIWARWEIHPWYEADGALGGIVIFVENITRRKDIERMKDEFISTVSHELRTPLTSIRGSLGLVLGGAAGTMSDRVADLLKIAHRNCDRLILLINDILDMNKIEADKLDLNMAVHDLATLLKDAKEATYGFADKYGVELDCVQCREPVRLRVDALRFQQVMVNLISNAVKFSPKDEPVRIGYENRLDHIVIYVADQGPGIPREFQDRIFERFAQADSSDTRAQGGTGLGLSIARALVEKMGGEISFTSRPGQTIFRLKFPIHVKKVSIADA